MSDVTRGITNRECREVVRAAVRAGCEVTITGGGHIRISTPKGPVFTGMTTSDRHAHKALAKALTRKGVEL